ncbi:MAG: hypothetical protein N3F05_05035 [Candidatus Diapherotrites archaeon]|nr:hypothetical protein [Candidatus Diapherotrites archaeon]
MGFEITKFFDTRSLNECLVRQDYKIAEMTENIEIILYTLIAFSLPFLLSHTQQQLIVGSIVNAMLVLAALNVRGWKLLPIIVFPSIGVFVAAVLFGAQTKFILYFMPFIWIGNAIIVLGVKYLYLQKKLNEALVYVISSLSKAAFLFVTAFVMVSLALVPPQFLTVMGIMQLITALIGSTLAAIIQRAKKAIIK